MGNPNPNMVLRPIKGALYNATLEEPRQRFSLLRCNVDNDNIYNNNNKKLRNIVEPVQFKVLPSSTVCDVDFLETDLHIILEMYLWPGSDLLTFLQLGVKHLFGEMFVGRVDDGRSI